PDALDAEAILGSHAQLTAGGATVPTIATYGLGRIHLALGPGVTLMPSTAYDVTVDLGDLGYLAGDELDGLSHTRLDTASVLVADPSAAPSLFAVDPPATPTDTPVVLTLTGSHLRADLAVTVGGLSVPIIDVDPTGSILRVTAPASAVERVVA